MPGPPKIISNNTQYGTEGDSVRVECVSFSVPKPDFIMWSFEGREINTFPNQEYVFLEKTLADHMTKSTLVIRKSEARHFGSYNCTVINSYGMETIEIILVADKTNSLIFIVSGLSSAAILVLVVMLVVMLCYRRAKCGDIKKPDVTDISKTCVDQFKDTDGHSNISDLKLELRQVEESCDMISWNILMIPFKDISNGGSEADLHPTLHLTSNLGLPLAGPVSMPEGYENELMKQYQRYSGDFNQAINSLQLKAQGQSNGYIPYVDYSRDYAPPLPSNDSLTGSLTRSTEGSYPIQYGSLHRQSSCGRLPGVGPDVIPMANSGVMFTGGVDVRYAATYGNPYLRGSASAAYAQQVTNQKAPPPYYAVRNSNMHLAVNSSSSPSSSSSSRPVTSPLASSSSNTSGAQPQVPKLSMQSSGSLYVMSPSSQGTLQATQIISKGEIIRLV
ncbi:unnamed protein product [Diatraea saccharalis]|uniref:Ig-like domain-containing protein n=1 Tax=Diatraea saccharalis TaxID=40085 RepID=A0A9N9R5K1_9NEOP|nr:unnamed protein product [Diatraea saccharalis]